MSIAGRYYLDPGDRFAGYYDPPRLCRAVAGPGPLVVPPEYPWLHLKLKPSKRQKRGGPRNALVVYEDGSRAVVPINRRLRRADNAAPETPTTPPPRPHGVPL